MGKKFTAVLLCFLISLSACSKDNSEKESAKKLVKVAFWGSPEEIAIVEGALAVVREENPDIEVRLEHTPFSGYPSKILTRVAGGAAPDIIATEVNMFVSFASKNVLADLNPFLQKDPSFSKDDFFPQLIDRFTVDGKLLAIPRDTAPFACVFYNKDIFDKAGIAYPKDDWTLDEMLETAKKLTKVDANGRTTHYGFYGWAWQNFVYAAGGAIVDNVRNPTRCVLDSPQAKAGLQFYVDLINKHKVMPAPVALANLGMGVDIMFSSGRLGMFLSGIWETPSLRTRSFGWDVAMFPKGADGTRSFGTGGTGYAILESSKNKEAAWQVIKALTGPQGQEELAKKGLAQPARVAVAQSAAFAQNQDAPLNKKMLNEAVQYAVYEPFHPKWREIEAKAITPELDVLFNGKESVDEATAKMVSAVNAILNSSNE